MNGSVITNDINHLLNASLTWSTEFKTITKIKHDVNINSIGFPASILNDSHRFYTNENMNIIKINVILKLLSSVTNAPNICDISSNEYK